MIGPSHLYKRPFINDVTQEGGGGIAKFGSGAYNFEVLSPLGSLSCLHHSFGLGNVKVIIDSLCKITI